MSNDKSRLFSEGEPDFTLKAGADTPARAALGLFALFQEARSSTA